MRFIFYQELKVLFSFIDGIVEKESRYSSGEEFENFENVRSATTK